MNMCIIFHLHHIMCKISRFLLEIHIFLKKKKKTLNGDQTENKPLFNLCLNELFSYF